MKAGANWIVLGLLLLALVAASFAVDRGRWPGLVGDEATYLLQAESLAFDADLLYERGDYDRFVAHWQRKPEGLILQSRGGGGEGAERGLTFGKPVFYSLYLAPFLRFAPVRGAAVANALLLALTALLAARTLSRRVGAAAPLVVAALVFASVTFAHVFWAHQDLFLMCLTGLAFSLAYGGKQHRVELTEIFEDARTVSPLRYAGRWAVVGALLAVVVVSRPFYAPLLLPAALAVPINYRRRGLTALAAGAALLLLLTVGLNLSVRGTWSSYGGERQGFYSYTGFPEVDLPDGAFEERVRRQGGASWLRAQTFDVGFGPRQSAWNALYFFAGRHVGVLIYFLPFVLGLAAFRPGEGRGALLLAVALSSAAFLYLKPVNFYGGGDALANRYFLPLYPALWFVAARARPAAWALGAALAAAPFLLPLWADPWGFPRTSAGGYRHVSPVAQRWLPYETTQSHLKPSGAEDIYLNGLWLKSLSPRIKPVAGGKALRHSGGGSAQLLIGSSRPIEGLELEFRPPAPTRLDGIGGATLGETVLRGGGGTMMRLRLAKPRARHRMWWTEEDVYLYALDLRLPADDPAVRGGATFELRPR